MRPGSLKKVSVSHKSDIPLRQPGREATVLLLWIAGRGQKVKVVPVGFKQTQLLVLI
jgi:hypothetical protein